MRISDWSSDVCSSDLRPSLGELGHACVDLVRTDIGGIEDAAIPLDHRRALRMARLRHGLEKVFKPRCAADIFGRGEIGRASSRERVVQSGESPGVAVSLKTKTKNCTTTEATLE